MFWEPFRWSTETVDFLSITTTASSNSLAIVQWKQAFTVSDAELRDYLGRQPLPTIDFTGT